MHLLILNGPNLNMLGQREPEIYGTDTLDDVKNACEKKAAAMGFTIDFRQSNHEGVLLDWLQEEKDNIDGLIINAAAYTHTSIALHDALKLLSCPIIEVHLSDPAKRESFRHISYIEPIAKAVYKGLGINGYIKGLEFFKGAAG